MSNQYIKKYRNFFAHLERINFIQGKEYKISHDYFLLCSIRRLLILVQSLCFFLSSLQKLNINNMQLIKMLVNFLFRLPTSNNLTKNLRGLDIFQDLLNLIIASMRIFNHHYTKKCINVNI